MLYVSAWTFKTFIFNIFFLPLSLSLSLPIVQFLYENIVGSVIVVSLFVWIPISTAVHIFVSYTIIINNKEFSPIIFDELYLLYVF